MVKEPDGYQRSIVGRGAAGNPKNRFERIEVEPEPEGVESEESGPETVYLRDVSRSIIARNDSPDIGSMPASILTEDAVMDAFIATLALCTNTWVSQRV